MPERRRARPLAAAVLVAAALGCSGGDDPPPAGEPATTTTGRAAAPAAEANTVAIEMQDYRFQVGGALVAGTSTVAFRNTGKEVHMAGFGRLADGRTVDDAIEALASEDADAFDRVFAEELDAPGGLLGPGEAMEVTTPFLQAGTYAVMCFVPTVGEEVPHSAKGMVAELRVTEGDARPAPPEADAVYAVGDGAIDGPAALPAGPTTLEGRSGAGGPHELVVARKKAPGTTYEEIDAAYTALFEGETPPAPGYADALPAAIAADVFDVEEGATVLVTLDLRPGDYLIGCARRSEDGEAHTAELLEVKVT